MNKLTVRRIEESDAKAVSDLIRTTLSISNKKDYPEELMDQLVPLFGEKAAGK